MNIPNEQAMFFAIYCCIETDPLYGSNRLKFSSTGSVQPQFIPADQTMLYELTQCLEDTLTGKEFKTIY